MANQIIRIDWDVPGTFEVVKIGTAEQANKAMTVLMTLGIQVKIKNINRSEWVFQSKTTLRLFLNLCDLIDICFKS